MRSVLGLATTKISSTWVQHTRWKLWEAKLAGRRSEGHRGVINPLKIGLCGERVRGGVREIVLDVGYPPSVTSWKLQVRVRQGRFFEDVEIRRAGENSGRQAFIAHRRSRG